MVGREYIQVNLNKFAVYAEQVCTPLTFYTAPTATSIARSPARRPEHTQIVFASSTPLEPETSPGKGKRYDMLGPLQTLRFLDRFLVCVEHLASQMDMSASLDECQGNLLDTDQEQRYLVDTLSTRSLRAALRSLQLRVCSS